MTRQQFKEVVAKLGWTSGDVSENLRVKPRTARHYLRKGGESEEMPGPVTVAMEYLARTHQGDLGTAILLALEAYRTRSEEMVNLLHKIHCNSKEEDMIVEVLKDVVESNHFETKALRRHGFSTAVLSKTLAKLDSSCSIPKGG